MEATSDLPSHALALVTEDMEATSLHERGVLKTLRAEAGPLVLVTLGLALTGTFTEVRPYGSAGWMILALGGFEGIALLQFSMWLDRVEVKPVWLLIRCALWGAGPAIIASGMINHALIQVVGLRATATLSAPVVEEGMKGLALVWLLKHRRNEIHDVLDAAMYAICVGIGFATVENVEYYVRGLQHGPQVLAVTVLGRGLLSPFAHPLFTFCTATGIAAAANGRKPLAMGYSWLGYACAVSAHALWNTFPAHALVVMPAFVALVIWVYRTSRREERMLIKTVAAAAARSELPPHAVELLGSCRRPRFFEWSAAAVNPDHPLYERWRRHHLALILASDSVAAQIAANDASGTVTASDVQRAAGELLRERLTRLAYAAPKKALLVA